MLIWIVIFILRWWESDLSFLYLHPVEIWLAEKIHLLFCWFMRPWYFVVVSVLLSHPSVRFLLYMIVIFVWANLYILIILFEFFFLRKRIVHLVAEEIIFFVLCVGFGREVEFFTVETVQKTLHWENPVNNGHSKGNSWDQIPFISDQPVENHLSSWFEYQS